MINAIKDESEIIKILRQSLIQELELEPGQVLNALSFRGADLHKEVETFIYNTFSQKELIIIFELVENDSSNNLVYPENDSDLLIYASYSFKLTIYGNQSGLYSRILKARFLTDEVLTNLQENGIYIYEITNPSSGTEFINDVIWERKDLDINISVRFNTKKISKFENFSSIEDINTITLD